MKNKKDSMALLLIFSGFLIIFLNNFEILQMPIDIALIIQIIGGIIGLFSLREIRKREYIKSRRQIIYFILAVGFGFPAIVAVLTILVSITINNAVSGY